MLSTVTTALKNLGPNIFFALYSLYAALLFILLGLTIFVPSAVLLPKLTWRRRAGQITMRLFCLFSGIRVRVNGLEQLPLQGCVVVANHCSYLDGPLLAMALPNRFSLVIKNEAGNIPLVGFLLSRVDHLLVERRNPRQAAADAQRIIDRLEQNQAVGLFAEGTFYGTPGVRRFKPSAFIGACRHQVPIVPVGIEGTRHIWPDKRRTLRPGLVTITLLKPITVSANQELSERQQARDVAEQARSLIAEHIGEPLV